MALLNFSDVSTAQMNLFGMTKDNTKLMAAMDRINGIWGRCTFRSAAEGIGKSWKMKRERISPGYTTCWEQMPVVC